MEPFIFALGLLGVLVATVATLLGVAFIVAVPMKLVLQDDPNAREFLNNMRYGWAMRQRIRVICSCAVLALAPIGLFVFGAAGLYWLIGALL